MKAIDKIKEVTKELSPHGIEFAEREAELMIRYGLGIDPVNLYSNNPDLNDEDELLIHQMVTRRTEREPLQYIIGTVDFMNLKLEVGEGVLIPRPETELMAEYAIKIITNYEPACRQARLQITNRDSSLSILDLCTGSGCLALAIAKEFPKAEIVGCDDSEDALNRAKKNAEINKVENVKFIKGDLFKVVRNDDLFDMIISNPPYIRTEEIKGLQPEVRDWEPLNALDGGEDGLDYYRLIIPESIQYLKNNGIVMFEHGDGQSDHIAVILDETGFRSIEMIKDYSGKERVIQARWTR
jgi:release factor glutamine methyltransferase